MNRTVAVELINVAMRDYEASKILFERGSYPQAIFLLQQSLEKAIKAILLKLDIAEAKELERRIGHRIIMNFLDLIVYRAVSQLVILLGEGLGLLRAAEEQDQEKRRDVMDLRNKIGGIVIDKLPLISTMVREFEESKKVILKNVEKFRRIAFEQMNEEVRKELENAVTVIGGLAVVDLLLDEARETYATIVNELASMFPELQSVRDEVVHKASIENALAFYLFTLIYWYAVFEPIVSIVRYPDVEEKLTPLGINENTVIVQWCKEIIQFIDKTDMLTCIKEFIEEKPETTRCLEILKTIENRLKVVKVKYE